MVLPHLILVTPDAMLASSLSHLFREGYRFTPMVVTTVLEFPGARPAGADGRGDLVVLDARTLSPVVVQQFVAAVEHPAMVLLAPPGLRTAAVPSGVRGALTHAAQLPEFRLALEVVQSGQEYLSPRFAAEDRLRYWQLSTPPTERQRELFELKRQGMKNEEIARQLGVTRKAVEATVTELRHGLGLTSGELFDWRDGRLSVLSARASDTLG
jgi:DNA-binding NarL/FixJ family response regulator